MLFLVLPDGDEIAVKHQDVGRLQNRIREQSMHRRQALFDLILKAGTPLQKSHRRYTGQNPCQFRHFRYIRLPPEDRLFRVQAQSQIVLGDIQRMISKLSRLRIRG